MSPVLADNHLDSPTSQTQEMPMNESSDAASNIVEVASASESFNTLVQAIEAAGLADKLSDSSASYTVFAPTDEAFNQLPDGALDYLLQPENQELLQQVLSYHVIPSAVESSEISSGSVETLGGGLALDVTDDRIVVNNASVVDPNIQASNGVIHGVNRVLLPEDLQSALASELGVANIYQ
ncbi:MAG TPA: fasciclin domain-containing protein [Xenococcaceae cyanobacterium]